MILKFKNVRLTNFGSYRKADISLSDRGFCLVSGENRYIKDNALSNGAGKSTIWSAICYALTGATINGVKSDFMNIFADGTECSVELEFSANADEYVVKRYYKPKSDMKIAKNGTDISGKGITESEKVLESNLPDLTKDLISSTIILGQGMPNKFSSFTPSGRKALLERLTKSDFMVEDIKARLEGRLNVLNKAARECADSILVNATSLGSTKNSLQSAEASLEELVKHDYDAEIAKQEEYTSKIEESINAVNEAMAKIEQDVAVNEKLAAEADEQAVKKSSETEAFNAKILEESGKKSAAVMELNENYQASMAGLRNEKYALETDAKNLQAEIVRLKSIKDVCPACGQKLPNVMKPDTSAQEKALAETQEKIWAVDAKLKDGEAKYAEYKKSIDSECEKASEEAKRAIDEVKKAVAAYRAQASSYRSLVSRYRQQAAAKKNDLASLGKSLSEAESRTARAKFEKENFLKQKAGLESQIDGYRKAVAKLESAIALSESAKSEAEEHLAIVKKMLTLTQRDFRGYLLEDIIRYIDLKAKDYCQTVFGTSDISVYLDKNDLDISYCGKLFDSLSGGEKQRCDLILQFAIRDLLQNYLGYSSNILVLDEIFDGLDRKSTDKVIELVSTKLRDVESIFIISHHSDELELPADSEIRIVKNEEGISEVTR